MASDLSVLLRSVRRGAGFTQLELALRLGVSQRHLSFVEGDRARPSRALLLAWLREAAVPPALCDAALLVAGHAPQAPRAADDSALHRLVARHEPHPALVFDADWFVVHANTAAHWLCDVAMPGLWQGGRLDMIDTLADPRGWLARARAPEPIAAALLGQLRAEQWLRPTLRPRIDTLETALRARYPHLACAAPRDPSATCFDVTLDTPLGALSFSAVQAIVGLPQSAVRGRRRAELWYPADEITANVLARHAPRTARPALAA